MASLIWGSILVLFGAQLIIQALFGISLPLVRVAFGLLIVYWGLIMLTGSWSWGFWNIHTTNTWDSHVVFGSKTIDLSTVDLDTPRTVQVNTQFGKTRIKLNRNIPTRINATASLGTIIFPDHSKITHGTYVYNSHNAHFEPVLTINANTTFGTIIIKNQ